ncbi:MAG: hypothetical protein LE168_05655, partial [Endomicrobium sp.]|nr:hypothetical protein [Endomicrobium sp.]
LEVSSNSFLNKVSINGIYTLQNAIELRRQEINQYHCNNKRYLKHILFGKNIFPKSMCLR